MKILRFKGIFTITQYKSKCYVQAVCEIYDKTFSSRFHLNLLNYIVFIKEHSDEQPESVQLVFRCINFNKNFQCISLFEWG